MLSDRKYTGYNVSTSPADIDSASAFLVPAPPSIPPTPGPDQAPLQTTHLPPIVSPDLTLEPTIPVPVYSLPTRAFPVQPPPKVPTGYAPTHPVDPKRTPVRKWTIMQREIKGIGGGRWFARTWVAPQTLPPQPATRPSSPPILATDGGIGVVADDAVANAVAAAVIVSSPQVLPPNIGPSQVSPPVSRASSVKAEAGAAQALLELDQVNSVRWPTVAVQDPPAESAVSSRGPASLQSRSSNDSPPPPPSPGVPA